MIEIEGRKLQIVEDKLCVPREFYLSRILLSIFQSTIDFFFLSDFFLLVKQFCCCLFLCFENMFQLLGVISFHNYPITKVIAMAGKH